MSESDPPAPPRLVRVLLDARTIRPGMTGVGRATLDLTRALGRAARASNQVGVRAIALRPWIDALRADPTLEGVEWIAASTDYESHPAGEIWLCREPARLIQPGEVYHGPAFILPPWGAFPSVVTINDLSPRIRPQDHPFAFRNYLRAMSAVSMRAAARIIAPTRAVADEIANLYPAFAHKTRVIPWAIPGAIPEGLSGRRGGNPAGAAPGVFSSDALDAAPFFLCVGSVDGRKNVELVAEALARVNASAPQPVRSGGDAPDSEAPAARVIWAGAMGNRGAAIQDRVSLRDRSGAFAFAGRVDDDELESLRSRSTALIYPSFYEGFGFPPLEAMAAGVPVLASDIPVLREVCGGAALYFSPQDPDALAALMRRLLDDEAERRRLIQAGRERAAQSSWDTAAAAYLEVYRELLH